jgi:hypothetical protein
MAVNKVLLFIFCSVLISSSCIFSRLKRDSEIASEICDEVGSVHGNISYSETTDYTTNDQKTIPAITMNIDSSFMIKKGWDKKLVASYCATQLYERLDEQSIGTIEGFEITFDNVTIPEKGNIFYFSKQEIINASKALSNVNDFIKAIYSNSQVNALTYYDTSEFYIQQKDINKYINQLKDSVPNLIDVHLFYTLDKYSNDKYYYSITALLSNIDGYMTVTHLLSKAHEDYKLVK